MTTSVVGSCGCIKTGPKEIDYVGHIFSRLKVLEKIGRTKCRQQKFLCECECGRRVTVNLNALRSGATKSCGCYRFDLMKSKCGANSPLFNPNLTDEDRVKGRNIPTYNEWVVDVKRRDNYKCVCCGSIRKLVSHHLNGYHWFKEGRFDLNNGACLCHTCHKIFHKIYGLKFNTAGQFNTFLEKKEYEIRNIR